MIAKLVVLLAFGLFARVLSWMKDFSQKCQLTQWNLLSCSEGNTWFQGHSVFLATFLSRSHFIYENFVFGFAF